MSAMGRYDITNDEQLRILTKRLDEIAADRLATNERLDQLVLEGKATVQEWQGWRRGIEERLADAAEAVAERLKHPLMDPETVEEMRAAQAAIAEHLTKQDAALADLSAGMNHRFTPLERITATLDRVVKMLRWVLLIFGGGFFYEVGRLVVDRWLK